MTKAIDIGSIQMIITNIDGPMQKAHGIAFRWRHFIGPAERHAAQANGADCLAIDRPLGHKGRPK